LSFYLCVVEFKILDIIQESPRVRRFFLESKNATNDLFLPGQFLILQAELPKAGWVQRSYSIASEWPSDRIFEICVAFNERGQFTPWLFQKVIGDTIVGSGPQGQFIYKLESREVNNIFVCTGTGSAPFRSMIADALKHAQNQVHLVFGNRFQEDMLYHDHWLRLEKEISRFHYHPVLSRVQTEFCAFGYVHPLYQNILKDDTQAHIYVCGWKYMLQEARRNLKEMGFTRKQYHFEQYD
jgi:CDP-4-dehydro-6-deoxyglucose reductase